MGEKKAGKNEGEKKADKKVKKYGCAKKDTKPKEAPVRRVVMKIISQYVRCVCLGCTQKIQEIIAEYKGVNKVTVVDRGKHLVKVVGTMDVKTFIPYLKEKLKLKHDVEVISPRVKFNSKLATNLITGSLQSAKQSRASNIQ